MPFLDSEISRTLAVAMERTGVRFQWNNRVLACAKAESGKLTLRLASGDQLTVDAVSCCRWKKE